MSIKEFSPYTQKETSDPKSLTIAETAKLFDTLTAQAKEKTPEIGMYAMLKIIAQSIPRRVSHADHQEALRAALSHDKVVAEAGKKAVLSLNAKTILSAVDLYYLEGIDTEEEREEMTATAIAATYEKIQKIKEKGHVPTAVRNCATAQIGSYIALRDNMPPRLALNRLNYRKIKEVIGYRPEEEDSGIGEYFNHAGSLTQAEIETLSEELSTSDLPSEYIAAYINFAAAQTDINPDLAGKEDPNQRFLIEKESTEEFMDVFNRLPYSQQIVLKLLAESNAPKRKILGKVANQLNKKPGQVRLIRDAAITTLRRPHNLQHLKRLR